MDRLNVQFYYQNDYSPFLKSQFFTLVAVSKFANFADEQFYRYAVKYAVSSGAALGEVTRGDGRLFYRCGTTTCL